MWKQTVKINMDNLRELLMTSFPDDGH